MLLAFASNDTTKVILWVVLVGAALGLITLMAHTALIARRSKNGKGGDANGETPSNDVAEDEQLIDAANVKDLIMSRNVIYSAGADGNVREGKYILHSADGSEDKFNLRYNGLVKEYQDGDTVTLADGDTLSPVSGSVILNKAED